MERRARVLVTSAMVAALFSPVVIDRDDFPLSTYPMYARQRPAVVSFVTAQGIDQTESGHVLSLQVIGASDDPLIVSGELRAAIALGRADRRCEEIAVRVTDRNVLAVEVVTERHDVVDRVSGRSSLIERTVHARCDVVR